MTLLQCSTERSYMYLRLGKELIDLCSRSTINLILKDQAIERFIASYEDHDLDNVDDYNNLIELFNCWLNCLAWSTSTL